LPAGGVWARVVGGAEALIAAHHADFGSAALLTDDVDSVDGVDGAGSMSSVGSGVSAAGSKRRPTQKKRKAVQARQETEGANQKPSSALMTASLAASLAAAAAPATSPPSSAQPEPPPVVPSTWGFVDDEDSGGPVNVGGGSDGRGVGTGGDGGGGHGGAGQGGGVTGCQSGELPALTVETAAASDDAKVRSAANEAKARPTSDGLHVNSAAAQVTGVATRVPLAVATAAAPAESAFAAVASSGGVVVVEGSVGSVLGKVVAAAQHGPDEVGDGDTDGAASTSASSSPGSSPASSPTASPTASPGSSTPPLPASQRPSLACKNDVGPARMRILRHGTKGGVVQFEVRWAAPGVDGPDDPNDFWFDRADLLVHHEAAVLDYESMAGLRKT
jgi:hypothetical protein